MSRHTKPATTMMQTHSERIGDLLDELSEATEDDSRSGTLTMQLCHHWGQFQIAVERDSRSRTPKKR